MPTIAETFNNPKFQALSPADKIAVLQRIDPNFAKLSPQDQQAVVAKAAPMGFQQQPAAAPAAVDPEALKAPLPGGWLRQLARPQNWSLEGVPETFGREVGSGGSTLNPVNIAKAIWGEAQTQAQQAKDAPFSWANIRHGLEGPGALAIDPLLRSLAALKDYRNISPEQALSVAPEAMGQGGAQALLMRGPINKLAGTATPEAGPLLGTMTRARAALDEIETAHAKTPVNAVPAFKIALRAFKASQRGYNLPKPIADFLDHMRQGQSFDLEAARDFSKSLREKIPWKGPLAQPGAKAMNGLMKDMRGALEEETATALRNDPGAGPKVADAYLKAKLEYGKGSRFVERGGKLGHVVGAYAGYELGRQLGHPLEGASAGGFFGRRFFGPLTGGIAKQWADPSVLAGAISKTAGATSAARKAATPFAAPFTAPFRQPAPDQEEQ